jgi:hypothetical protein
VLITSVRSVRDNATTLGVTGWTISKSYSGEGTRIYQWFGVQETNPGNGLRVEEI